MTVHTHTFTPTVKKSQIKNKICWLQSNIIDAEGINVSRGSKNYRRVVLDNHGLTIPEDGFPVTFNFSNGIPGIVGRVIKWIISTDRCYGEIEFFSDDEDAEFASRRFLEGTTAFSLNIKVKDGQIDGDSLFVTSWEVISIKLVDRIKQPPKRTSIPIRKTPPMRIDQIDWGRAMQAASNRTSNPSKRPSYRFSRLASSASRPSRMK